MSAFLRILLLFSVFFNTTLSHVWAEDTTTILLFGDSIIAGYGLSADESVPAQLQEILQKDHPEINIINGGVSGDTTSAGRSRLAWTLDKHELDIVVLALGGNDVLRGIPPDVTRENIDAMLALLNQRNIPTILSVVQPPDNYGDEYHDALNMIYTEAAEKYDVPLYPFLISDTFGNNDLMQSDGIHPNERGAKHIAEDLAEYLKQLPSLEEIFR